MDRYSSWIIKHRKSIVIVSVVLALICAFLSRATVVNSNMVDYLPDASESTQAIHVMNDEFTQSTPDTDVMIQNCSIPEALDYKAKLAAIDGVSNVTWLDDIVDINKPLQTQNQDTVDSYYKDGNALISFTVRSGDEVPVMNQVYSVIGDNPAGGSAATSATMQEAASSQVSLAMSMAIPLILIILILTTTSWIEPLLYFAARGIAVLINMGTNALMPSVSFVTNAVTPILQLAISLDYAIILLHG
ncbi:MAG: MMPL family transporter, partial [Coriobacteriales bacterium]|nr:MMPL family transporter [Coriobacteriales bacterium]